MGIAQDVGRKRDLRSKRQVVPAGLLDRQMPGVDFQLESFWFVPERADEQVWEWWVGVDVGVDFENALMTGDPSKNNLSESTFLDSDLNRSVLPLFTV